MGKKKVVIVGGGIVGLCSAYYLNKKGLEVEVLDAGNGRQNCSVGNAGYFCPSHVVPLAAPGVISQGLKWMLDKKSPFYIRPRLNKDLISWGMKFTKAATKENVSRAAPVLHGLTTRSQKLIEEIIQEENLEVGYAKQGLLMICQSEKELQHEIEAGETARALGQRVEVLSAEEAKKLNPGMDITMKGAVYFPDDSMVTPHAFIDSFYDVLKKKGVQFHFNTKVTRFHQKKGILEKVSTNLGQFTADEFILAAGSRTSLLGKQLGLNLPMQGGKGYSFIIKKDNLSPRVPAIFCDGKVSMSPMLDGVRFSGTMEIDRHNDRINPKRIEGIIDTIIRFIPELKKEDFKDLDPWHGFRPCSPDGFPYIGKPSKFSNLTIATGHAMLGVTLGPVSGHLVADIITGEKPFIDLGLLNVDRYN